MLAFEFMCTMFTHRLLGKELCFLILSLTHPLILIMFWSSTALFLQPILSAWITNSFMDKSSLH
jgi:hypothetical protein